MNVYEVKSSGKEMRFDSGMVRDIDESKTDYTLIYDGPLFDRWAKHLTAGARRYAKRNWMKASGQAELDRFRESAARHFRQWLRGDADEDHASACVFNINGALYCQEKIDAEQHVNETATNN